MIERTALLEDPARAGGPATAVAQHGAPAARLPNALLARLLGGGGVAAGALAAGGDALLAALLDSGVSNDAMVEALRRLGLDGGEEDTAAVPPPAAAGAAAAAAPPAAAPPPPPVEQVPLAAAPTTEVAMPATEVAIPSDGGSRSPAEDPAFQAVASRVAETAARQRAHMPATSAAASAQDAAPAPGNDVTSQAAGRQAERMEQTPTPGFDRAAFKARLLEQIAAAAPKDPKEAKNFPSSNRLGEAKEAMTGEVGRAKEAAQGGLRQQAQQPPDTTGLQPKPVAALDVPQQGALPPGVQAGDAAPKPLDPAAVATPFQERNAGLDRQLADAEVTEAQLAQANEPSFTSALSAKHEAVAHGQQAPQTYHGDEAATLTEAQAEAEGTTLGALGGMHEQRGGHLEQVALAQEQTMTADHSERAQVAAHIEGIYERTRQRLTERLQQMDDEVARIFDAGSQAARTAFEQYVDERLDDRYSGLRGKGRWLKDKVFSRGLAAPVARIFQDGRERFIAQMDTVIDQVVDAVERGITDARTIVAEGRQEIATYVEGLPVALQQVGQQAASDIQGRFDELEQSIDARQGELIDSLARRYSEQVQALDSRIEELESEHASFVSRAWNAVKGVIEAIWRLKDLLLNVIARAASAIGDIITNPIGFLGNLVDGVRAGLDNFVSRIWDHLSRALQEWLFGALSGAGLSLPDKLDEMGILDLVMQVLGMTYQNIRARAVRIVGEDVVARLEQFAEPFVILIKEGPGGLWDWIKEQLGNLKDRVLGEIQDWVVTKVIKAGIVWIVSLLNPAAAFIKACKAIYEIIMFFIERGSQIMEMVNAVIDSIAAIAKGAIGGVATKVENALGRILPVVIGFLASLLNLGGISDKIREIITKLREPVGDAVDWLIDKSVALVRAAGNLLGLGPDGTDSGHERASEELPDERTDEQKAADAAEAARVAGELLGDSRLTDKERIHDVDAIKDRYRLTSLEFVELGEHANGKVVVARATVNPTFDSNGYIVDEWPPDVIRIRAQIGQPQPRQRLEEVLERPRLAGFPGAQRLHAMGAGWGVESIHGIFYGPELVNQGLQNRGIEQLVRDAFLMRHPDAEFYVTVDVRPQPGTEVLGEIIYRLDAKMRGDSTTTRLLECAILVEGVPADARVSSDATNELASGLSDLLERFTLPAAEKLHQLWSEIAVLQAKIEQLELEMYDNVVGGGHDEQKASEIEDAYLEIDSRVRDVRRILSD